MNLPTEASPVRVLTEISPDAGMPIRAKIAAGLALLTLFIFLPVVNCEFINYDDDVFVTNNPNVAAGLTWEGIKWAFTSADIDYWRPLSWLSHMLDIELFSAVAGAHHLTSLLIHCAAVVMVFIALHRLTGALWPSAVVAALFAWHPLHVESVAWVAERKDVLCGFFWFFTLWAYARYVATPTPRTYLTMFAGFVLAIMSKPMAVTLPCVLLLLDFWPLRRIDVFRGEAWRGAARRETLLLCWMRLKEKLPLFGVVGVLSLSTVYAQHKVGAMADLEGLPVVFRLTNAVTSYGVYLAQTVWPSHLCILYPMRSLTLAEWMPATALLVLISGCSLIWLRRYPWLLTGWLWFLGVMFPVVGVIQVGEQAHADRYTYLPLVGVFIAVVWSVNEWATASQAGRKFLWLTTSVALVACAVVTRLQLRHWPNSVTVFARAISVTENNASALNNLGAQHFVHGQPRDAIWHLQRSLRIYNAQLPWINLSWSYSALEDHPRSLSAMSQAIAMDPRSKAMDELKATMHALLKQKPNSPEVRKVLAMIDAARKDYPSAVAHLQAVIDVSPADMDARIDQAAYLAVSGKEAEAIAILERTVALAPTSALAQSNLAALLAKHNRSDEARQHHQAAIAADPKNLDSRHNYALFLARSGRTLEARQEFESVLASAPGHLPATQQLGWLLASREECRDGARAVALATRFAQASRSRTAIHFDLMAAASAAAGDFKTAIEFGTEAIEQARSEKRIALEAAARARQALYLAGKPFTEPAPAR